MSSLARNMERHIRQLRPGRRLTRQNHLRGPLSGCELFLKSWRGGIPGNPVVLAEQADLTPIVDRCGNSRVIYRGIDRRVRRQFC